MLHYSISEIIKMAFQVSQCGSADIPFATLIHFVDNEYRNLQNELIRSGRSGIMRIADLELVGWNDYYNCYEYQIPYGVNQIINCYRKNPSNNELIIENVKPTYSNYTQYDDRLYTNNPGPLFIEYNPILKTPTFTRKAVVYPNLIAYDNITDNKFYISNNEIIDDHGDARQGTKIRSINGFTCYLNNNTVYEWISNTALANTGDFEIDGDGKSILIPVNNRFNYTWKGQPLYLDDQGSVILDDNEIATGVSSIVVHPDIVIMNQLGKQTCLVDNQYELYYDEVIAINPSENTGFGVVASNNYQRVLGGYTPDTELEFFHTVYYDVMIYRVAGCILSYLGMPMGSQAALMQRIEDKAFQQNKRSHNLRRIKNVRAR